VSAAYRKIIEENLERIFADPSPGLHRFLGAERAGQGLAFPAFGLDCSVDRNGVTLSRVEAAGPRGLLITLYALHGNTEPMRLEPFRSFKELPGSMPYQGAFSANSEMVLVPHVPLIREMREEIKRAFQGEDGHDGDFSFVLYPLPKIALYYIFYMADEEFPASATCLFSSNALSFMPLDGLADVAEYTSKEIVRLVNR